VVVGAFRVEAFPAAFAPCASEILVLDALEELLVAWIRGPELLVVLEPGRDEDLGAAGDWLFGQIDLLVVWPVWDVEATLDPLEAWSVWVGGAEDLQLDAWNRRAAGA
jgi:hypothetical protein